MDQKSFVFGNGSADVGKMDSVRVIDIPNNPAESIFGNGSSTSYPAPPPAKDNNESQKTDSTNSTASTYYTQVPLAKVDAEFGPKPMMMIEWKKSGEEMKQAVKEMKQAVEDKKETVEKPKQSVEEGKEQEAEPVEKMDVDHIDEKDSATGNEVQDNNEVQNEDEATAESIVQAPRPRGRPKSGKTWKAPKKPAASVRKSTRLATDLRKKVLIKEETRKAKELADQLKNERKSEAAARREREAENKRRKEENAKKAEVVQVIKKTHKVKRLKKSQLRSVQTRDTSS